MPSHRSRSRSKERTRRHRDRSRERSRDGDNDKSNHRRRSRSRSPEHHVELPEDAQPLAEKDYFQKSDEFRVWLKEEKGKYFDELTGDRARSYFRKFIKAWNRGKLSRKYYRGIEPGSITATTNTSYKWTFASKGNRADEDALRATREAVGAATYGHSSRDHGDDDRGPSRPSGSGRQQGPALPSEADLTLAREMDAEQAAELRAYKRKRDKLEAKERIEDMVGPRPVGREAMLEKKRARRENDKDFRERGDEGLEVDEDVLLGGGDSFQAQLAKRDAAKKRYQSKNVEQTAALQERATVLKEKDKATMDMFQQLAKQRFG